MNTKTCIILVGLPAVGKSTWVEKNFTDTPHVVLSTDNILEEVAQFEGITYDESFKKYASVVEAMLWKELDKAVEDGWDTLIVDRTNMSVKARRKFIERLKPNGYSFQAVVFPKPVDGEWERRLAARPGKTIPEFVIKSMEKSYVYPTYAEGFQLVSDII